MNSANVNIYWFLFPLVAAISLVYAATRHEDWRRIWRHATRGTVTILLILAVATAVLSLINTFV
jgi:hypothetical protein